MGFDHFHNAIAINPEKIMQMRADNELLVASQLASFNYVDGAGVSVMLSCRTVALRYLGLSFGQSQCCKLFLIKFLFLYLVVPSS